MTRVALNQTSESAQLVKKLVKILSVLCCLQLELRERVLQLGLAAPRSSP